ncbi:muramidase [Sphingomonas sp. CFBP9021]|uniref:muramidase n=1 Tax=Sphingomonas sp. CFBP9021 TaxID=3096534 RepID=UPI002A6B1260|nr:muramidase [Sphingomonas sp. CFBP9021]MDY0969108.1 muramidase [Sphingomonas sp. CFBP9021]
MTPLPAPYAISVHAGAALSREPVTEADAEATVRDLITLGADFVAGPLAISGQDFATYGVTPASVFDPCALAHIDDGGAGTPANGAPTVSNVAALIRRAFGARITDTIRPMNASYGARYSWHKYGQAVDFVPAGGVNSINRDQIRALMGQSGIRLIELLGPGDRGHSNHWHVAFARPGQVIDRTQPIEENEDWIVNVASADAPASAPVGTEARIAPASVLQNAAKAPPQWDVFASAKWRASQGGGS